MVGLKMRDGEVFFVPLVPLLFGWLYTVQRYFCTLGLSIKKKTYSYNIMNAFKQKSGSKCSS